MIKKKIDKEKKQDPFHIKIYGLSEDMEDFILEQNDYYNDPPHKYGCSHCNFFQSFYKTCVDMWSNGIDLSDKQLNIIYREYNKVQEQRIKEYKQREKEVKKEGKD